MDTSEAPRVRLPGILTLFGLRAERFCVLAASQPSMAGYLALMAELADIQQTQAREMADTAMSAIAQDDRPPLDIATWPRTAAWRDALAQMADRLNRPEEPIATVLDRIRRASGDEKESWAQALLAADFDRIDAGLAPFVAAALQTYWVSLAARLNDSQVHPQEPAGLCPVCGSRPVASLLQSGGAMHGLRYLCCSMCATQWNCPRIQCIHCGSNHQVAYYGIDGAGGAVKAEACGVCKTYLKIMDREKDGYVDPFADDIASLNLDLLMAEQGYQRLAINPLLLPGA